MIENHNIIIVVVVFKFRLLYYYDLNSLDIPTWLYTTINYTCVGSNAVQQLISILKVVDWFLRLIN